MPWILKSLAWQGVVWHGMVCLLQSYLRPSVGSFCASKSSNESQFLCSQARNGLVTIAHSLLLAGVSIMCHAPVAPVMSHMALCHAHAMLSQFHLWRAQIPWCALMCAASVVALKVQCVYMYIEIMPWVRRNKQTHINSCPC